MIGRVADQISRTTELGYVLTRKTSGIHADDFLNGSAGEHLGLFIAETNAR